MGKHPRTFLSLHLSAFILAGLLLAACGLVNPALPADQPVTTGLASLPLPSAATAPAKASPSGALGPSTTAPPAPVSVSASQTPRSTMPTLVPSPTAQSAPVLRQLTSGGCCVQPFWSPDSQWLLYIDRPYPDAPTGLWRVSRQGGAPEFSTDRLGIFSPDFQLRAFPQDGQAVVERLVDGQRWVIPNGGRSVSFSPDSTQVAWSTGRDGPPFNTGRREIWISQVDGSQARKVFTVTGGFSGWLSSDRLLVNGQLESPESGQVFWALTIPTDEAAEPQLLELGRARRLRSAAASPDGEWLAYLATFSQDPNLDGLWLANTHSGARIRLGLFGAYQWRDSRRLLVIPLDLSQPVHRLWQVEVSSGQALPLTDPALSPFKIANGDWRVSPDGRAIVFVSANDHNIWVLELP